MFTVTAPTVIGQQVWRDRTLDQALDLLRVMAENGVTVTITPVAP